MSTYVYIKHKEMNVHRPITQFKKHSTKQWHSCLPPLVISSSLPIKTPLPWIPYWVLVYSFIKHVYRFVSELYLNGVLYVFFWGLFPITQQYMLWDCIYVCCSCIKKRNTSVHRRMNDNTQVYSFTGLNLNEIKTIDF